MGRDVSYRGSAGEGPGAEAHDIGQRAIDDDGNRRHRDLRRAKIRPGSAERFNKPNYRMWAAVVETPKGAYFVKFASPIPTVTQALTNGDFDGFVKSLRFE